MTPSTESALTPSASDAECLALTRQLRRRGTVVLSLFALALAFAGASGTGPATDMVPVAVEAAARTGPAGWASSTASSCWPSSP
ncbi:hypothetical protein [Streptomyces sp. GB4-14]|uniref:hypothetical protein n=1 Tax=Streptomyces sp. GB4-14 TaxID=2498703 RepID=UPI001F5DDFF5